MKTTDNGTEPNIPTRDEFHRHFGGEIFESDFNTNYGGDYSLSSRYATRFAYDLGREAMLIKRMNDIKRSRECGGYW